MKEEMRTKKLLVSLRACARSSVVIVVAVVVVVVVSGNVDIVAVVRRSLCLCAHGDAIQLYVCISDSADAMRSHHRYRRDGVCARARVPQLWRPGTIQATKQSGTASNKRERTHACCAR